MTQVTEADIYEAALQWCGEKDRETSLDDIRYFQENWSALPGLRRRAQAFARYREQGVAERDARIAELEGKLAMARKVLPDMIDLAHGYAEYIASVPYQEIERHPYLPGVEAEINEARAALKEIDNAG